ncbi:hypothetical protein glysoja_033850 [Glycine soja]|uniref:Uncharacterized protein n=1 Tax=Glycine soja TaxID=3848 RepID=A0A0B2PJA2_GLYSO|nr:hypothetical protein glysoja_033850 [Glycine soja]
MTDDSCDFNNNAAVTSLNPSQSNTQSPHFLNVMIIASFPPVRVGAMGVFLDQRPLHLLDWDPVKISVGAREFLGDGGGFGL